MKSPTTRLSIAALGASLFAVSLAAHAALSSPTDARVSFQAGGSAGMHVEGSTAELAVSEQDGNLLLTVPLANLTTGIGLRDRHMRETYLEVQKYPTAVLTIARSAVRAPQSGEKLSADVPGTLLLHGQTRPVSVHYDASGAGGSSTASGAVHINMNDYGITVPSYLGVTIKPDVNVTASFHVAGS